MEDVIEIKSDTAPLCKLCKKKLRKFRVSNDYENRCYHKKCFEQICEDVRNFHQVAYTKYGYTKKYSNGKSAEENKETKEPWIVNFD